MRLPRIYQCFQIGEILTIDEARARLKTTGNTLRKRLSELTAQGYLLPIRQGLYRLQAIPAERLQAAPRVHPFAIAAKISPSCHLMYKSALYAHAGLLPLAPDTILVGSVTKFNQFVFQDYTFCWCPSEGAPLDVCELSLSSPAASQSALGAFTLKASSLEQAIIDCLRRPVYAPPLGDFLKICLNLPESPRIEALVSACHVCGVSAVFNRLGYFLERLQDFWDISDEFLRHIQDKSSKKSVEWPQTLGGHQPVSPSPHHPVAFAPERQAAHCASNRWRILME